MRSIKVGAVEVVAGIGVADVDSVVVGDVTVTPVAVPVVGFVVIVLVVVLVCACDIDIIIVAKITATILLNMVLSFIYSI